MIKISNLNKTYFQGNTKEGLEVLKGINLEIDKGEYISIMGTSGSGKSTFLKILGLVDYKYKGEVLYDGVDLSKEKDDNVSIFRGENIGFVFQDFQLIERLTVFENLELALISINKYNKQENSEAIVKSLKLVGLEDKINSKCSNLSGGQKQRIAIARAIIKNPKLLIADEPTGALDDDTSIEIMKLFKKINDLGQTIVIVTHDREVATSTKKIYNLTKGVLHEEKL